jgi:hypothetical protein
LIAIWLTGLADLIGRRRTESYLSRKTGRSDPIWAGRNSILVRDKDFAPVDICPDRLNSFYTSSSNVRRPTVRWSTVPSARSFVFSNVNLRDVFIAMHRIGSISLD